VDFGINRRKPGKKPMTSANQSQIVRLAKDIANFRKSDAQEAKKEADLSKKIANAQQAISRTKSPSTHSSKLREIERATRDIAVCGSKRADIASKVANKTKNLHSYQQKTNKEEEDARKRTSNEQKKLIREREDHDRRVRDNLRTQATSARLASSPKAIVTHDFFISHASEDKEGFVRSLATILKAQGAVVWYDEFSLKVGDSLRRNIDAGLATSRFGVVVLSENFFRKEWPNKELDGLVAREVEGRARILPIWHKVSKDEVAQYSPTLADKVALNTSLKSVEEIAADLMALLSAD
jgi:hypothetical protein